MVIHSMCSMKILLANVLYSLRSPLCVAFVSIGGLLVESSKDDGWKFRKKILTQQLCGLS